MEKTPDPLIPLVEQALQGDADALQRLMIHYHPALHRTVDGRLSTKMRRHVDPEDVLQQAYIAAFQGIRACRFDGPAGFYKWLEQIALNKLANTRRDLQRKKRDIDRLAIGRNPAWTSCAGLIDRLAGSGTTPTRHMARQEVSAAVLSSVARLTEDQRKVVRMRFLEGQAVEDIAAALGKSIPAIHMLCHRGLKSLRELMDSMTNFSSEPL